jgi:diaminopimelate decarboxylase
VTSIDPASSTGTAQRLDECLSIRDGELWIGECRVRDLAERFATPLYVMSEDQLRRNARRIARDFSSRWPGDFLLLPSIKANPSLALRRILTEEGTGCDVFGFGELEAALRTDTPPGQISLNGPLKSAELLERAIRLGVRITLDSAAELDRARRIARELDRRAIVRLRFRPDLLGFDEASEMSTSGESVREAIQRYKAGIPTEDILAIPAEDALDPHIDLAGLHFHLGRHSAEPGVWSAAVAALCSLLDELRGRWEGWAPRELDAGGGYPAPRDPFGRLLPQRANAPERSPGSSSYAEAICGPLAEGLRVIDLDPAAIRLEIEPGRSLYADAGIHLATVGNVKRQGEPLPLTWVETDSSDAYLPDVNLEHNRWQCLVADRAGAETVLSADVTGRSCALDVIVPEANLPEVAPGDVLAFLDTGAYQDSAAHNFNALPRPGTALVRGDDAELIRRHETLDDVFARDLVPARLAVPAVSPARASALDHVSVTCADLDRSLAFYVDLLGLELRDRGEGAGGSFEITGLPSPSVRWADVLLDRGQVLELIEYQRPRGQAHRAEPNDPGASHLALRVDDAAAVHSCLTEAGVVTRSAPTIIDEPGPWNGARAFYATDPDGVILELIEPAAP